MAYCHLYVNTATLVQVWFSKTILFSFDSDNRELMFSISSIAIAPSTSFLYKKIIISHQLLYVFSWYVCRYTGTFSFIFDLKFVTWPILILFCVKIWLGFYEVWMYRIVKKEEKFWVMVQGFSHAVKDQNCASHCYTVIFSGVLKPSSQYSHNYKIFSW